MKNSLTVKEALEQKGIVIKELANKVCWKWQMDWRKVFAHNLFKKTGKWILDNYDWHVFSFNYFKCAFGDDAKQKFNKIKNAEYFVVSSYSYEEFGFLCNGPIISLDLGIDINIFPASLSWTMSFTHESECGPYFATQ